MGSRLVYNPADKKTHPLTKNPYSTSHEKPCKPTKAKPIPRSQSIIPFRHGNTPILEGPEYLNQFARVVEHCLAMFNAVLARDHPKSRVKQIPVTQPARNYDDWIESIGAAVDSLDNNAHRLYATERLRNPTVMFLSYMGIIRKHPEIKEYEKVFDIFHESFVQIENALTAVSYVAAPITWDAISSLVEKVAALQSDGT